MKWIIRHLLRGNPKKINEKDYFLKNRVLGKKSILHDKSGNHGAKTDILWQNWYPLTLPHISRQKDIPYIIKQGYIHLGVKI